MLESYKGSGTQVRKSNLEKGDKVSKKQKAVN